MHYLKTLSSVTQHDVGAAGQRAADLALLQSQRFSVPHAFVVTAAAFDALVAENNLKYKIDYILGHVQLGSPQSLTNAYTGIRKAILEAKLPAGFDAEIKELFESITSPDMDLSLRTRGGRRPPVRIILSCNRIDDPETNDTIIQNVKEEELLTGVREAWALAYHPRLIEARLRERFPESRLRVALVVQAMDKPAMTAHAYTSMPHDHGKVFLQTYYGYPDLRERISKDYYALDKNLLTVLASEIHEQPALLDIDSQGELVPVALPGKTAHDRLIERQVQELARLAKKAERVLGAPAKLFFAVHNDTPQLLWANRLGFDVILGKEETPDTGFVEIPVQEREYLELPVPEERPQEPMQPQAQSADQPRTAIRSTELRILEAALRISRAAIRSRYPTLPDHDLSGLLPLLSSEWAKAADLGTIRAAEQAAASGELGAEYSRAMEELASLMHALASHP